jgi:hypothetical protein
MSSMVADINVNHMRHQTVHKIDGNKILTSIKCAKTRNKNKTEMAIYFSRFLALHGKLGQTAPARSKSTATDSNLYLISNDHC